MSREFFITYKVVGLRRIAVRIPNHIQLPLDWESWDLDKQDEWLYQVQLDSRTDIEDIHTARAVRIEPSRRLELVK
jgi:hypothetical protein